MSQKYTLEILRNSILENHSVAGVLRSLKLKPSGSNHSHITKRIKQFEIDTSHFTGKASNKGSEHKGACPKLTPDKILILRTRGIRRPAFRLRRALIESGVDYKCNLCGLKDFWNGKELRLQVDHKNRNWLDDRIENLQFLCPNCHSQTEGWGGNKGGTSLISQAKTQRNSRKRKAQLVTD